MEKLKTIKIPLSGLDTFGVVKHTWQFVMNNHKYIFQFVIFNP